MAAPIQVQLYAAAAVVPKAGQCCEAAASIASQRFLMAEVPMLPLDACTRVDACACKYQKFDDRRQDDRRALSTGFGSMNAQEQRDMTHGRRSSD